jgi:hypothetical protein
MKKFSFLFLCLTILFGGVSYSQTQAHASHITGSTPVGFESEINVFLQQDSAMFPPSGAYLFAGSSSIAKWDNLASYFQEIPVIQRGFGGSSMKALNYYINYIVLPYNPATIVVYEGDNDLVDGTTPHDFAAQCDTFIMKVHSTLPNTMIWFLSIKPTFARYQYLAIQAEANRQLKELTQDRPKTGFIDITQVMNDQEGKLRKDLFESDSLHVNPECYRIWADHMKAAMGIHK